MTTLRERYDTLLFDLDGTLFRGGTALPGAPEALAEAAGLGCRIGYLTNNGSRNAGQVVEHLRTLGFAADESEVVTSGQAAARLLSERLKPGDAVVVVGSKALAGEVTSAGFTVADRAEQVVAVLQGHSPDTGWRDLAEACLAIRAGALWVATNVDATLPDERGELPGNGSMVAALVTATESEPVVAGKPEAALFDEAVRRAGAERPLMVGDRLETDIAGANGVRMPSLLVLTGVSDAATLLAAPDAHRPTYVGADLTALRTDPDRLRPIAQAPWRASRAGDELRLELDPAVEQAEVADPVDALRTLCAAHWAEGGGTPSRVTATDPAALDALRTLGLTAGG